MASFLHDIETLRMQKAVAKEAERLLNGIMMVEADGSQSKYQFMLSTDNINVEEFTDKVNVYLNRLPVVKGGVTDADPYFPYCIVRLISGETKEDDDYWHVPVVFYFGTFDGRTDTQGDEAIQVMIQTIANRFSARPAIERTRYRANQEMNWVIQEEDTYPYFFGSLMFDFLVPKVGREDIYTDGFA